MIKPDAKQIQQLLKSGQFDAEWYLRSYPDVASLGMDPAEHYLTYGYVMKRATTAKGAYATVPIAARAAEQLPTPDMLNHKRVLMNANEVAKSGDHASAIALAETHLPSDLAYTANVLRANAAVAQGDEKAWQTHLNNYLSHFDVAPIRLQGAGTVFDRLACDPLPKVTGGPLISVIMPAWNAEKTVRKAALSILSQTWGNLELLIVDDCSTDGTWAVLQQIAATDSRVKIMRNKVNVGPYVSKNIALMQAKGEWITGHDADDWALPQRLERHASHALHNSVEASLMYMARLNLDGAFSHIGVIGTFCLDSVARKASISCLFSGDLLRQKLGFWDSVRFAADSEMIARAEAYLGSPLPNLPMVSMFCLDLDTSLTNNPVHGVSRDGGISTVRADYRSSWADWLRSKKKSVYLDFPQRERRYSAAEEMIVPYRDQLENKSLA